MRRGVPKLCVVVVLSVLVLAPGLAASADISKAGSPSGWSASGLVETVWGWLSNWIAGEPTFSSQPDESSAGEEGPFIDPWG